MNLNIKCKDRAPFVDQVEVQVGWYPDGRRKVEIRVNPMSKSCQFDLRLSQPGCQGCKWQVERDLRDGPGVSRLNELTLPTSSAAPATSVSKAVSA